MSYSAKAIANYYISKYKKTGISPLKIQKLVYLAHAWHLAFHDEPLVQDEYAEAWAHGPVFSSLYHEFKYRGRLPINHLATDIDWDGEETIPDVPKDDHETVRLLDRVWEVYGDRSGFQLSSLTHQDDSPWHQTRVETGGRKNANIPDKRIKEHYKKRLEHNKRQAAKKDHNG